jgi:hypothetical protein
LSDGAKRGRPLPSSMDDEIAPFQRLYGRIVRRLVRLAVSRWYGFVVILAVGVGFAALAVATFVTPYAGRLSLYIAFGAWLCVGLLLALIRHALRRPRGEWKDLGAMGRVFRLMLTIGGTAILSAPIAWIVWKIFSPR